MKLLFPILCVAGILVLAGCSSASEGNSDAAAEQLRREMPKPQHEALPVDENAHVIGKKGGDPVNGTTGK